MTTPQKNKKRIVFLYSDTGGGHRSAAEAIMEALELEFPGHFDCVMVDFFEDYSPPPFNMAGPIYPVMSRMDHLWKFSFEVSDDPDRMRVIYSMFWPYIRIPLYRLVEMHPCDLFVSVHPLINIPLLRAMKRRNIHNPYIIVVTDLVSTHTAWFTNDATRVIIPTEQATKKALQAFIQLEKLKVIGLPVAERFCKPIKNKHELREDLGWSQDKLTVLLVGGGEGMGPLEEIARQIDQSGLDIALAIVTGRNLKLKESLDKMDWKIPAHIYGFVREMPALMRASDILLTKAGPGTISEALIAGLPIILYHRISGQEEGNVAYVIDEGAGIWAPDSRDIVETLKYWIENPEARQQAVNNANRLARPNASRDIAKEIASYLQ